MSEQHPGFRVQLEQQEGYAFRVRFDTEGVAELLTDEPPPLGQGGGPNPVRLLAAAVGNCLSASLLFCLQKSRVQGARVGATVTGSVERNERGRWRVAGMQVQIHVEGIAEEQRAWLERCRDLFEEFCIVTESVRHGVPVEVHVTAE